MHSNKYTIIFTMLITMVLAFVLSSVYSSLEEQTERNFKADIKKNILSSLGFAPDENTVWNTEDVEAIFKNSVISFVIDKNGDIVKGMLPEDIDPKIDNEVYPIYKKMTNDKVEGFAIPISGKGLWGTMYGYFAIEPDGATAKGITFYKHVETPGLGAEVDKPWFQQNYIGKKLNFKFTKRREGDPPILIASSEKAKNELGWIPKYPNLEEIVQHAFKWHIKQEKKLLNL